MNIIEDFSEKPILLHVKKEEVDKEKKGGVDKEVSKKIDVKQIKKEVEEELRSGMISKKGAQVKEQREPIKRSIGDMKDVKAAPAGAKKAVKGNVCLNLVMGLFEHLNPIFTNTNN